MNRKEMLKQRHTYNADNWVKVYTENLELLEPDPIIRSIFAVNPVTGKPNSDLGLIFSSETSLEVQQYIRENLATARQQLNQVSENADDALQVVRSQFETIDQYVNRVRDYVSSLNNTQSV